MLRARNITIHTISPSLAPNILRVMFYFAIVKQEDSGEADYRRYVVRGDWTPLGQLVMPWVGVKGEAIERVCAIWAEC